MHMKHSIISPWPVPELTGVQWVEPLPQASYMLGYCPSTAEEPTVMTNSKTVETRHQLIKQH